MSPRKSFFPHDTLIPRIRSPTPAPLFNLRPSRFPSRSKHSFYYMLPPLWKRAKSRFLKVESAKLQGRKSLKVFTVHTIAEKGKISYRCVRVAPSLLFTFFSKTRNLQGGVCAKQTSPGSNPAQLSITRQLTLVFLLSLLARRPSSCNPCLISSPLKAYNQINLVVVLPFNIGVAFPFPCYPRIVHTHACTCRGQLPSQGRNHVYAWIVTVQHAA